MIQVNANVFCQALLLLLILAPSAVLGDAGYDAKQGPAAMAGMDHSKMKMNGQGDPAVAGGHWRAPEDAVKRSNPVAADRVSRQRGRKLFSANCASCHGAKGRGDGPAGKALNPKPADLTAMAGQHPDGDFAWKIANGRGAMPAWKGTLKEHQIWDLVNYFQSLAPGKNKANSQHPHDRGHNH